mgnify:FL=1
MKKEELKEEGVVAGDHGGDPVKIASGELSGNFVNAGPGEIKKKKKTKLKRSKVKEIVERHKD